MRTLAIWGAVAAVVLIMANDVGAGGNRRRNSRVVVRRDTVQRRNVVSRGSAENQAIINALAIRLAEQQQLQTGLSQLGLGVPYGLNQQRLLLQQQGIQPYQSGTAGYIASDDPFRRPAEQQVAELVDRQQRTAERLLELQEAIAQANLDRIDEMRSKVPDAGAGKTIAPAPAAVDRQPPVERQSTLVDAAESCGKCHNPDKQAGDLVLDGSVKIDDATLQKAITALVDGEMPKTPAGHAVPLEGEQLARALHKVALLAK